MQSSGLPQPVCWIPQADFQERSRFMKAHELNETIRKTVETLANETDQARQSELFRDFLRCASLFHNYSFGNQMLIWSHRPTATRVAGYQTWRKMDRFVKACE